MFGAGSLDAGTLLGLGVVLAAVGAGARWAAGRGIDPFPLPVMAGLLISAVGPLHALRPAAGVTRAGAEIAVVVLLFCAGLDHGVADRRTAAGTILSPQAVVAADAAFNFAPGALFALLAGFGPTGAVLLGGATWGSSWAVAAGTLDRRGHFGNRETPAVLAVLVLEHAAAAVYLPLAVALLAPGGTASRLTALLGSAAATIAAVAWLTFGPPPVLRPVLSLRHLGRSGGPGSGVSLGILLAGTALLLAGVAAALDVAAAAIAYLGGAVLASSEAAGVDPAGARPALHTLRELSAAAAGLGLGLLVPGARLPGAVAGGLALAAITGATKVVTGWWAAGRLRVPGPGRGAIGRAGRIRAGLVLVPRGELAVALGVLVALAAPGRGPGTGLAALIAAEVVLTGLAASAAAGAAVRGAGGPGWYRLVVPTPAGARPEPPGAR